MGRRVNYAMSLPHNLTHQFTHVVWEVDNHTHIAASGGYETIEDLAEMLAEAVYECARSRDHVGIDGRSHCVVPHDAEEAEKAYKAAIYQLQTRDYWSEFLQLQHDIEEYELWGSNAPALVFQPKVGDTNTWQAVVKNAETGRPIVYDIPTSILDLPRPDPKEYVEGQFGYYKRGNVNRSLLPTRRN